MTRAAGRTAGKAADTAGKAGDTAGKTAKKAGSAAPGGALTDALGTLAGTLANRAASSVAGTVSRSAQRLTDYADGGGGDGDGGGGLGTALTGAKKLAEGQTPVRAALSTGASKVKEKVKSAFGGGGSGKKGGGLKLTNIVEAIDVGVPVDVAYDQWTRFTDFPTFMKKVENVEQESDEKLSWKAQVLWSHRSWDSTITDQVPDQHIVWRSKGEKGYVDGAVTFHELGPNLTRILLVLEYHPQGFFEQTGNLWRAQGRRARLELKHFRRHVMTKTLLHPEELEGWRGTIHDEEVVDDGSDARPPRESGGSEDEDERDDDYDEGEGDGEDYEDEEYDDSDDSEESEDEEDDEDQDRDETEQDDSGDDRETPARRGGGRRGRGGRA
ncbi:SRPBCC family protein [Saccharomonospora piscinae]|uniref:SRPBCC family protein n=1 Tax=Saccharomonospora piscinae TaxID=687388 RepID=UPI001420A38B|nr:SRPBCC family protein [Saccharomonospora piscinae]